MDHEHRSAVFQGDKLEMSNVFTELPLEQQPWMERLPFTSMTETEGIIPMPKEFSLWKEILKILCSQNTITASSHQQLYLFCLLTWEIHLRMFLRNHFRFLVHMKTLMTTLPWTSVPMWVADLERWPCKVKSISSWFLSCNTLKVQWWLLYEWLATKN